MLLTSVNLHNRNEGFFKWILASIIKWYLLICKPPSLPLYKDVALFKTKKNKTQRILA